MKSQNTVVMDMIEMSLDVIINNNKQSKFKGRRGGILGQAAIIILILGA